MIQSLDVVVCRVNPFHSLQIAINIHQYHKHVPTHYWCLRSLEEMGCDMRRLAAGICTTL